MKIGLILNLHAGRGPDHNRTVVPVLLKRLVAGLRELMPVTRILVPQGTAAELVAEDAGVPVERFHVTPKGNRDETIAAARLACQAGAGLLVVLGGDGTLSDAALGILLGRKELEEGTGEKAEIRLMGIGIGTTNAGALVAFKGDELLEAGAAELGQRLHTLRPFNPPVLVVSIDGEILGLGFNDCALGFTVPTTVHGRRIDADAVAMMEGRRQEGTIRPIGGSRTEVWARRRERLVPVAKGCEVGQVIIGTVDGRYVGKAVSGGACLTALVEAPAALVIADKPVTRINVDQALLERIEPVTSRCFSLFSGDGAVIKGLSGDPVVCVDGNPLRRVNEGQEVAVTVSVGLVTCLKPVNAYR